MMKLFRYKRFWLNNIYLNIIFRLILKQMIFKHLINNIGHLKMIFKLLVLWLMQILVQHKYVEIKKL